MTTPQPHTTINQDTAKFGAIGALVGAPNGWRGSLTTALRNVIMHRAALDAAADEYRKLHGAGQ